MMASESGSSQPPEDPLLSQTMAGGEEASTEESGDFEVGDLLENLSGPVQLGEYQIEQLIGSGGMGRVYRAEHRRMGRTVALKTLPPERMADPAAVTRFYSEIRAAARLLHPNIVTAFDAGESGAIHYLAMEYVEGRTLTQEVAERGPLAVAQAVRIIRDAAHGLSYAHRAGIVHRDVKPGNVMIAEDGTVKVLDLGLATVRSELQRQRKRGRLVGTVEYIAPEQLEDPDAADARADIYALGGTFFFLLAGHSPFQGDLLAQLRAHRDAEPPDLFAVRHDIDVRLDQLFRRMMAKRPHNRFASMDDVAAELDRWLMIAPMATAIGGGVLGGVARDTPTTSADPTTASARPATMGIDLGMFYAAAAVAEASGEAAAADADAPQPGVAPGTLLRCAVATRGGASQRSDLLIGGDALAERAKHPERAAHCLQLYLGQSRVDRAVLGGGAPPEALLGLLVRQIAQHAWDRGGRPMATALTVPGCYDQLHRRSIRQAAEIAGCRSIRLVDRPLAAAQALLSDQPHRPPAVGAVGSVSEAVHWLVVSVSGVASEVAIVRVIGGRCQELAVAGSWKSGVLAWQQRLVDLTAHDCGERHGVDPRSRFADAVRLQLGCERALNDLLLRDRTEVRFSLGDRAVQMPVSRGTIETIGRELLAQMRQWIAEVSAVAGVPTASISRCVLAGSMTRMAPVMRLLRQRLGAEVPFVPVDRRAMARGAALAVAAELPGRAEQLLPPQGATAYDLGLLAHQGDLATPQPLPVVPRGTALPAHTHRGVTLDQTADSATTRLTVVESMGAQEAPWRSLGNHPLAGPAGQERIEVAFDVDEDGLLAVRLRDPASGRVESLPTMPAPVLPAEEVPRWRERVERAIPGRVPPRRGAPR